MADDTRAYLQRAEAACAGAGFGPVRRLGHTRRVEPTPEVAVTISPGRLELTVVARHAGRPAADVEAELRWRLGDRLVSRGFDLTHSDTAEATLPDAGPDQEPALVTEMVFQREVGLDALAGEIRFLAELLRT